MEIKMYCFSIRTIIHTFVTSKSTKQSKSLSKNVCRTGTLEITGLLNKIGGHDSL